MSILVRSITPSGRVPGPADDFWYNDVPGYDGLMPTSEGAALAVTAVYNAVWLLSSAVAMVPWEVFRRLDNGGKRTDRAHYLWTVLHDAPNGWMTSVEYRRLMMVHLLLRGNHYARIIPGAATPVRELIPYNPDQVQVFFEDHRLAYYKVQRGNPDGTDRIVLPEEMFHVRGLATNPYVGVTPITLHAQTIGLARAQTRYEQQFYRNSVRPSGVVSFKGQINPQDREKVRDDIQRQFGGLDHAHGVVVADNEASFKPITMTQQDAQFIESRGFTIADIARMFNVAPHLLKDLSNASYNNVEEMGREFGVYTIMPWVRTIEAAAGRSLMTETSRATHFTEMNLDGLLRADVQKRAEFYKSLFGTAGVSANEIRAKENLNPIEGGDQHFVPLNMVPLNMAASGELQDDDDGGRSTRTRGHTPQAQGRTQRVSAERAMEIRRRLRQRYEGLYRDAGERIVSADVREVRKIVEASLPEGGRAKRTVPELLDKLEAFYESHRTFVIRALRAPSQAYARAIADAIADEMGVDALDEADLLRFVEEYIDTSARRYVATSTGQLRGLVREGLENGADDAALRELILQRVTEWADKRAGKLARNEAVEGEGAFSREAYENSGVTRLVWRTFGENCPFCNDLAGRVVGVQEPFARKGEVLPGDGSVTPLELSGNRRHAPLHAGCDCMVMAA